MWKENVENITKSDSNFAPTFVDQHLLLDIHFNGHCLVKHNISIPKKVINLYISNTLNPQLRNSNTDFTFSSCLFRSVKITKNTYQVQCLVYGVNTSVVATALGLILVQNGRWFNEISFTDGSFGKTVIICGADMSSSVHIY